MGFDEASHSPDIEASVSACIDAVKEVSKNLAIAASNQAQELSTATKQGLELVSMIKQEASMSDINRLHHTSNAFQDSIDHILEVSPIKISEDLVLFRLKFLIRSSSWSLFFAYIGCFHYFNG